MTTRYRVEYALKSHRRDDFIEWIKGLTAGPFVLHAGSANFFKSGDDSKSSAEARRKYAEVFKDVELLVAQHIAEGNMISRLKQMVPQIGYFFTPLPLERAFYVQDERRAISKRRMVAPSFNDVRMILNTAQVMALSEPDDTRVRLMTFDGDVTLYDDGSSLHPGDLMAARLIEFMKRGIYVGIVTAAGYPEPSGTMYHKRLRGLIEGIMETPELEGFRNHLLIMGGECNYLFQLQEDGSLKYIEKPLWATQAMLNWREEDCNELMDMSEHMLQQLVHRLDLSHTAEIVRKERSVGVVPKKGKHIPREDLEEIVLNADNMLQASDVAQRVYFCAFNGGSDVWVDIGDKRYGVLSLQNYLGNISNRQTLHFGDQFSSVGANDYKARLAANTIWVASPRETLDVLEEFLGYLDEYKRDRIPVFSRN
ncbi:IMP 5'-nucleotidase [Starmerella bacillaris]|uniref:IMP-specific 5'-nucleotidase 1 n=1 Tax=Starmerella bacillaris TaxID=1247836 RepID=A0AAV5RI34_STABA|nr:IMP 5'-nucleotidase [Starmerella bacillaris]